MRKIIEQDGKFYPEETAILAEITVAGLEAKLEQVKAEKEVALTEAAVRYDRDIAELESDLAAINVLLAAS